MKEDFYDLKGFVKIAMNDDINKHFTKNKITSEEKCLNYLKQFSSPQYTNLNIDLSQKINESLGNSLTDMLDEWVFKARNEYGVLNRSFFKDKDGVCQMCNHKGCKELFKIYNTKSNKYIYVGCKCLLKLDPVTYIGDKEVTAKNGIDYINEKSKDIEKIMNSKFGAIFKVCHENNLTILENQSGIPQSSKDFYAEHIDNFGRILYSLIECIENGEEIPPELFSEARTEQHVIYEKWSSINNFNNIITFVPSVAGILDNKQKYSAKYKIVLSSLVAEYLKNRKSENKKNLYDVLSDIYYKTKNINLDDNYSITNSVCTLWIHKRYLEYNKVLPFDIFALILTLPPHQDKCKTLITNNFKIKHELKTSFSIKEEAYNCVKEIYKKTELLEDKSEFANYIRMIYNIFEGIMPDYLKNREPVEKRKNYNKHHKKNNLI